MLGLTAGLAAIGLVDARMIDGVSIWAKPIKFAFSIAVFALTTGWFFGYVRRERRRSIAMRGLVIVLIAAGSFELAYIVWQAAHGLASHFNRSSPYYEIMYALMGVGALLLTATTLPLAWEIARRPAPGLQVSYVASVVIGLLLCFVLGAGVGGYMAQGTGHSVGADAGHMMIFGWNRSGGDLRIAHFLGIHAQQAIPILGLALSPASPRWRAAGLVLGSLLYIGITLAVLAQAIEGHPLMIPGT